MISIKLSKKSLIKRDEALRKNYEFLSNYSNARL